MIVLGIISALLLILLYIVIHVSNNERDKMRTEFAEERQILLNRIQDPQYRPPLSPSEKRADMEKNRELREEFEQFGLVGKIME
jgi:hypothetical protein